MREIVPGITIWSVFSERMGLGWDALAELSPNAVYLTNRNHSRAPAAFRDRFSIPVHVLLWEETSSSARRERPGHLPDEAIDDRDECLRSAQKLSQLDFDALLLCEGEPVVSGGKDRLAEFVSASGLD